MSFLAKLFLSIAALIIGAWLGLKLPDIDQRLDLLLHRSIITHGPIIPLIVFLAARDSRATPVRLLAMSLCLGFLVHLAFDLFPKGWSGYALISLPIYGWLPSIISVIWIAGSGLLCAYWAARLVRGVHESVLLVLGTLGIFAVAMPRENSLLGPLAAVAVAMALASTLSLFRSAEAESVS